jgi:hypothetical protein
LRTRVAAIRGPLDIGHRLAPAAVLEQDQAEIGARLLMALARGALIPLLGERHIERHAPTELVGLGEIILRVRVAPVGERPPLAHRLLVIAGLPGIDTSANAGLLRQSRRGRCHRRRDQRQPPRPNPHRDASFRPKHADQGLNVIA